MSIRMPAASAAADKWKAVTPSRQNFYQQGVQAAAAAYDEGVRGAAERFAAGITQALSDNRWASGVEAKGAKFAMKAGTVGPSRWADGVSRGQADYTAGVTPFFQALNGMTLPPGGPKGHPSNYARSQAVGEALRAVKVRR